MAGNELLLLTAAEVAQVFDAHRALESQRVAFTALAGGDAVLPARLLLPGQAESTAFCYAARLAPDAPAVSKFGSVNPGNADRGLAAISAVITVLDPETGLPRAIMDGTEVTTLRTAAASALAAQTLAGRVSVLAVIGSGVQAAAHLAALASVLPAEEVRLFSRNAETAERVARQTPGPAVRVCASAEEAVRGADLIVTTTTSADPVLAADWVAEGATVISVGSFAPDRHELDQELLRRCAHIVVDDRATAVEHAGPIVAAVRSGDLDPESVLELGAILNDPQSWHREPGDIVHYNSVGVGIQDAAAAAVITDAAAARPELGTRFALRSA